MALNLNKGEQAPTPKITLKKQSLNLDKTPSGSSGSFSLEKKQNETIIKPSYVSDVSLENERKKPWALIIIAVLVIIGGLFWFMNKDSQESSKIDIVDEKIDQSVPEVLTPQNSTNLGVGEGEQPNAVETSVNTDSNIEKNVEMKSSESNSNNNSTVPSNVSSNNESIEDKARKVIMGNFGNGADRKKALANEYKIIQDKVNEMYRNGL